jgi:WD40 repeat protein
MTENSEPFYSPRENDIFISYSAEDDFVAKRLEKSIIKLGRDPWIDTQDLPPGMKSDMPEAWEYIELGIKNADIFVLILSPNSVASRRNQTELELAIQYQKRLIPVLYQPVAPETIPVVLKDRNVTWVYIESDEPTSNFEDVAKNILHIHIHQRLLDRVIEWYEGDQRADFLLYGTDLESVKQWFEKNQERKPYLTPLQRRYLDESSRANGKHLKPEQPDIFVSYSRKDRKFVEALCARLRVSGLNLWVDWENIPIAADWRQEIQEGIENAHTFLWIISPDSVASPYCQDEVTRAVNLNKRTIAVVWRSNYDRDRFNHPALAAMKRYNWLYCESFEQLGSTVAALIRAINTDLEYVKAHTRLLLQAIDWKNQDRREEFLLRKTELIAAQQLLLRGREIEQNWLQQGKLEKLPPIPLPTLLQQELVEESTRVETEHLRTERKRQFRIRILLSALLFFLGLTAIAIAGQFKALNREVEALVSSLEGVRELDALVNGLRAGQQLDRWGWAIERFAPNLRVRVVTALQQQIYSLREQNRLTGHQGPVYNVSYSPDGKLMASASEDGTVKLWNRQGELIQTLQTQPAAERKIASVVHVVFNPGIEANTYTLASAGDGGTINIWKIRPKYGTWVAELDQPLPIFKANATADRIFSLSFSQGGQVLSASVGNSVNLWRRNENGRFKQLTSLQHGANTQVLSVSFGRFSREGQTLASADSSGIIKVITSRDLFSTYSVSELKHGSRVLYLSFSPEGQTLASAGDDATVKLWMPAVSTAPVQVLKGHEAGIYRVMFSPSGKTIASASADGSVRLWTQTENAWKNPPSSTALRGHLDDVYRVVFSPNRPMVATAGADDTVKLWALDGTLLDSLEGHEDEILSLEFSKDGNALVSSSRDKTIRLWKIDNPIQVLPHSNRVYDVSFTADGKMLASSGQGTIRLWRTQDGEPLLQQPIEQPGSSIASISFAPPLTRSGEHLLAASSEDGTIHLWVIQRSTTGYAVTEVGTLHKVHNGAIRSISLSSDGRLLASAGLDGVVNLWQLQADGDRYKAVRLKRSAEGYGRAAYSVSFSPNGHLLASAGQSGTIHLWRLQFLADTDRYKITPLRSLKGHAAAVYSLSFSPDNHTLASASQDRTARLWELEGMLPSSKTLTGHGDEVLKVSFSPNGELLATAGRDDTVKLWTKAGQLITTLRGHRREVSSIQFSPDSRTLASASYDAKVLLWQLTSNFDLSQFLVQGCNLAQNYLITNGNSEDAASSSQYRETFAEVRSYCQGVTRVEEPRQSLEQLGEIDQYIR